MKLTSRLFGVILFLFFVFLLASLVHAQPGEARKAASIPKMEIPNTEVQRLTSIDGQEYLLYVYLPEGYYTFKMRLAAESLASHSISANRLILLRFHLLWF